MIYGIIIIINPELIFLQKSFKMAIEKSIYEIGV